MIIGYVMYKKRVIDDEANVRYTKLVLNISLPAQIITAFVSRQGDVSKKEVIVVFGISAVIYFIYAVIGALFLITTKVHKRQRGTYMFMMMFGNTAFMGFPVIEAVFGQEAMVYAVIFNVVFNFLVYSIGVLMIGQDGIQGFSVKKFINMPLMSALVSIVLFFADIQLPEVFMTSLEFLGKVTTPVAMLILGSVLAKMKFKELVDEWRVYVFTAVNLIVIPFVVLWLMSRVFAMPRLVAGVLIVLSAMPVATNSTMLAIEYDGDIPLTSKGIFFTTVLSIVTIPLIAMFC